MKVFDAMKNTLLQIFYECMAIHTDIAIARLSYIECAIAITGNHLQVLK